MQENEPVILVVDDTEDNLDLLEFALKRKPVRMIRATSGRRLGPDPMASTTTSAHSPAAMPRVPQSAQCNFDIFMMSFLENGSQDPRSP